MTLRKSAIDSRPSRRNSVCCRATHGTRAPPIGMISLFVIAVALQLHSGESTTVGAHYPELRIPAFKFQKPPLAGESRTAASVNDHSCKIVNACQVENMSWSLCMKCTRSTAIRKSFAASLALRGFGVVSDNLPRLWYHVNRRMLLYQMPLKCRQHRIRCPSGCLGPSTAVGACRACKSANGEAVPQCS